MSLFPLSLLLFTTQCSLFLQCRHPIVQLTTNKCMCVPTETRRVSIQACGELQRKTNPLTCESGIKENSKFLIFGYLFSLVNLLLICRSGQLTRLFSINKQETINKDSGHDIFVCCRMPSLLHY